MARYTPEQLLKRNASVWTDIQIILAPVQFLLFVAGVTITALYQNALFVPGIYWVSLAILFKTLFFALLFITGMFFEKQSVKSLTRAVERFEKIKEGVFDPFKIYEFAVSFRKEEFEKKIKEFINEKLQSYSVTELTS